LLQKSVPISQGFKQLVRSLAIKARHFLSKFRWSVIELLRGRLLPKPDYDAGSHFECTLDGLVRSSMSMEQAAT